MWGKTQISPFLEKGETEITTSSLALWSDLTLPGEGLRDLWFFLDSGVAGRGDVDSLVGPELVAPGREPTWRALG